VNRQNETSSSEGDLSRRLLSRRSVLKGGANLTAGTIAATAFGAASLNAQAAVNPSSAPSQPAPAKHSPSENLWETV
jgi:hypothetical protein